MYFLVSGICLLITLIMIIVKSFNNPVALALYSIVAIGCVVAFRIITKFLIPRRGLAAAVLVVFVLIPLRHVIRHSLWGGTYTSTLSVPEIMTFYLFLAWYFISIFVTRRAFEKAQERERNLSYMERESDKKKYDYITRDQVDSIDNSSQREMTLEDEFDNFVPSSNSNAFKSFGAAVSRFFRVRKYVPDVILSPKSKSLSRHHHSSRIRSLQFRVPLRASSQPASQRRHHHLRRHQNSHTTILLSSL